MAYVYPGQSYDHSLNALKGWYEESGIDAAGRLTANVNIGGTGLPAVRGLIVHAAGKGTATDPYGGTSTGPQLLTFEMGCGALQGVPMALWTPPTDPDVYNPGVPTGTPVYGTTTQIAEFASVLPSYAGGNLVALVLSGAYELETTEFDTAQTYTVNDALRAVTSNTAANAGKLTNQRGTTAAFNSAGLVQYVGNIATPANWDTIIGFVSRGAYVNANKKNALAFYASFHPGVR